jgi:flagellar basal-body rod modification protein FlgD
MQDQDFIAQLAQFSSLEQLQNMSGQLSNSTQWDYLLSQTINNTMAASIIGKSIQATTSEVYLPESDSAKINFELAGYADKVEIEICDKSGNPIRTIEETNVAEGDGEITWDGKDDLGQKVASGTYTVSIKAYDSDNNAVSANTLFKGKVDGVKYVEGSAYLMVDGLDIPLSSVVQIFQED